MPYEKKDGDWTLFVNTRKGDNEKAPDRTGTIIIDGVEREMAGWLKKDRNGNTFLAGNSKPKQERRPRFTPRNEGPGEDW